MTIHKLILLTPFVTVIALTRVNILPSWIIINNTIRIMWIEHLPSLFWSFYGGSVFVYREYPWTSYQIRKITGCTCAGDAGNVSPPPWDIDRDVPWCMPGSLTSGLLWSMWQGKRSGYPGACETRNFAYLVRGPLMAQKVPQLLPPRFSVSPNLQQHRNSCG